MKKIFIGSGAIGIIFGLSILTAYGVSVLSSQQVGTSPVAGSILQTNGVTSTWVATSSLGISGGGGSGGGVATSGTPLAGQVAYFSPDGNTITGLPYLTYTNGLPGINVDGQNLNMLNYGGMGYYIGADQNSPGVGTIADGTDTLQIATFVPGRGNVDLYIGSTTATRVATFQDKDGTIAYLSDITGGSLPTTTPYVNGNLTIASGTALATYAGSLCGGVQFVTGISASGTVTCGTPSGGASSTNVFGGTGISVAQVGVNATVTNIGVVSLLSSSTAGYIDFSTPTGTNITAKLHDLAITQFTGVLGIANGGTNATTSAAARTNLGIGTIATFASTDYDTSSSVKAVALGGTGATTSAAARTNLGLGTISTFASTDYITSSTNLAPSTTIPTTFVSTFNGSSGTYNLYVGGTNLTITTGTRSSTITWTDPGYVLNTRAVNTGGILSGGGNLSADRTISLSTSTLYSEFSAANCITFSTSTGQIGSTCITGNQTITLSGAVTGSGATSITTVYTTSTLFAFFSGLAPINFNTSTGQISITTSTFAMNADNLSGLTNTSTARTNLGLGSIATHNTSEYATVANNLSDLAATSTARTNLGLKATSSLALADANGIQTSYAGSNTSGGGNCLTGVTLSATGTLTNTNGACSGGAGGVASTSPFTTADIVVVSSSGALATIPSSTYTKAANNGSDFANATTTRSNLGIPTTTNMFGTDYDTGSVNNTIATQLTSQAIPIPWAGTIVGWLITDGNESCTASIDVWKANGADPTSANSITAGNYMTISGAQYVNSTSMPSWTTSFAANDVFVFNTTSTAPTCSRLHIGLIYSKAP